MPRREPAHRQTAGEPPPAKVKMRLDASGRWVPSVPETEGADVTDAGDQTGDGSGDRAPERE
jgi:hypothetical protein